MSENIEPINVGASTPLNEPVAQPASWKDSLPEDVRGLSTIQDVNDITSLVKSYDSAQRMLGNSVRIPSADASIEAKQEFYDKLKAVPGITRLPDPADKASFDAFYNALGRPDSPDNYRISLGENIQIDESSMGQFKQLAHSIGLTNDQAAKLAEFEAARYQAVEQDVIASKQFAEQTLKQEWGADYNNRLTGAKEAINFYAEKYPDAVQELVSGPAGNNPAFLAMLSELYGSLKEKGVSIPNSSSTSYGMTPEEAMAQIKDIQNNQAHPYWNAPTGSAEKQAALDKMAKLFQAAYPEG